MRPCLPSSGRPFCVELNHFFNHFFGPEVCYHISNCYNVKPESFYLSSLAHEYYVTVRQTCGQSAG